MLNCYSFIVVIWASYTLSISNWWNIYGVRNSFHFVYNIYYIHLCSAWASWIHSCNSEILSTFCWWFASLVETWYLLFAMSRLCYYLTKFYRVYVWIFAEMFDKRMTFIHSKQSNNYFRVESQSAITLKIRACSNETLRIVGNCPNNF